MERASVRVRLSRLFVVLAGCALLACATTRPAAARADAGGRVTLAPGGVAAIEGAAFRIRFDRVIEDSRCPVDVQCVRAGEARIGITAIDGRGEEQAYELSTAAPQSIVHGGVTIRLEALVPRPVSTRAIEPDEYRATLGTSR